MHIFEGLHHLLLLSIGLRAHLKPCSEQTLLLSLERPRPLVVLLDLLHRLLPFILLNTGDSLYSLLSVATLQVFQFLLVPQLGIFLLLHAHQLIILRTSLVIDLLLPLLLHLEHVDADILPVLILLELLLVLPPSHLLCFHIELSLALLSNRLLMQELLFTALLQLLILQLHQLYLTLLLLSCSFHLEPLHLSALLELLTLLFGLALSFLELFPLHS